MTYLHLHRPPSLPRSCWSVLDLTPSGARRLTGRAAAFEVTDKTFRATLDRLRTLISEVKKRV